MALRDLPIAPSSNGDGVIVEAYINELQAIATEDDVRQHVKRWQSIFNLQTVITDEEKQLIDGSFDASTTLNCILKTRMPDGCCEHMTPSCCGMHVVLPVPLMLAILNGNKLCVSPDIILIQANGGLGEL